ncbi:MAG: aminotransferase class I/II-fold pyridoxal phosphate-dependent enzyme [Planctomycetes bacterium]|nr:aminotransferase class I/II-fold pyridoxal phosphate-dependent enzyme [Planctomycetota bacterium]MCB9889476.1 aminotransferase class I/II-fold pyridoxal phosphate-dependent enzyme [Planctomycetota bacterium]
MSLPSAFEPEAFRRAGHALVDQLADYLAAAGERRIPVLAPIPVEQLLRELGDPPDTPADPDDPWQCLGAELLLVLERSIHLHHPGYVGHQVAVPLPGAALVELVNAMFNNGMAVYEMGQVHTAMEHRVVAWLARRIGFPEGAGGVLTHGGSLGNLTALLAARQANGGVDAWQQGSGNESAVLTSDQSHYCIDRAARVMGLGGGGVMAVHTDAQFRMRRPALEDALREANAAGRRVFAVVANACSTATGTFDPLDEVAEFCAAHGLWLHVDGAHGASLLVSERHRATLRGIERADSVVWDLHKMLMLPALNTGVVFRDARHSAGAFAQRADYLFDDGPAAMSFDLGRRTLECTKRGLGTTAWLALRCLGTRLFGEAVDGMIATARTFARLLREDGRFELATEPECNIVCFRFLHPGAGDLDAVQQRIRAGVVAGGRFYVVQTRLRGAAWLRTTFMNPFTGEGLLRELLGEIAEIANRGAAAGANGG